MTRAGGRAPEQGHCSESHLRGERTMEPIDPADPAYVTELQVVCRAEQIAEVLAQLPPGIEMAEVPTRQPPGIEGQPGVITLLGVVPDGVWAPDAEDRLRELGRQGLIQQHGLHRYRAGVKFVTFEEIRSATYPCQLLAVRPGDIPHPHQLP